MAKNFSESRQQHERRHPGGMQWLDQHGRAWQVEVDTVGMSAVGIPYLQSAIPPIDIPLKYVNAGQFGKITIEYAAWKRDILAREEEITAGIAHHAQNLYGERASEAIERPTPAILRIVGPRPIPIEFVMAMEAGRSPWVLGLRREDGSLYPKPAWVTEELEERLKASRRRFLGGTNDALPVAGLDEFADDPAPAVEAAEEDTPFADDPLPPVAAKRPRGRPPKSAAA